MRCRTPEEASVIVSHKHRFIFIKNRKVGSTSTELFLQQFCGPDDIITPDHLHQSETDVLAPMARNWEGRAFPVSELIEAPSLLDGARVVRDCIYRSRFHNHMRATSVRARVGKKVWNSYYKFCFERNPWDKAISFYYWFGRNKKLPEINDFFLNYKRFGTLDQVFPSDWVRYTLRNRLIVDDVFNYGELEDGVRSALRKIGIPEDSIDSIPFPDEKANIRKRRMVELSPETDVVIRKVFRNEIATFEFCREPVF